MATGATGATGPTGATPAITALVRAGVEHHIHQYDHDPAVTSFGDEAAAALGVDAARVFKTLVVSAGPDLVVAVVPVTATLDLKATAAVIGAKRIAMADPAAAERSSGYVVGAISPIGQRKRLTTIIDTSVEAWDTVFCSGGRRGLEIELAPADLLALTHATSAPIAQR